MFINLLFSSQTENFNLRPTIGVTRVSWRQNWDRGDISNIFQEMSTTTDRNGQTAHRDSMYSRSNAVFMDVRLFLGAKRNFLFLQFIYHNLMDNGCSLNSLHPANLMLLCLRLIRRSLQAE